MSIILGLFIYICSLNKFDMKKNTQAILLALVAVLSWSTVATAFKIALTYLTHFEMLLIASITSVLIFSIVLTF